MINKFRYKKPPKESPSDTALETVNSGDSDTLKRNKNNKTFKVLDNDLDAIRISDRINTNEDLSDGKEHGVLDENMKKQLHVRILPPSQIM